MGLRSLVRHRLALAFGAVLVAVACVISSRTTGASFPIGPANVTSPLKVHMLDGTIIVLQHGATFDVKQMTGNGMRYDPTLTNATAVLGPIPLDSVVGVETYDRLVNGGRTLVYSTASTIFVGALSFIAAIAIFGSCPTIYADSAGTPVLQAESFSYSVAPLLAKRDVDRLRVVGDSLGIVRLDVRNEALETHYLDQMELLEVRHARDELVLPVARAGFVAVRQPLVPPSIRDRAGRDLRAILASADERVFATDSTTLARAAGGGESDDYIDLVVPRTPGRDSLAIVLRARSSLLTTMLLYDEMLAGQGPRALDYVGHDLQRVTKLAQLANWYVKHLGLRVSVRTKGGRDEQQIVRLVDFGPAAWRDVAVVVPARADGDSVRVRLTFMADAFRIDRVAVSSDVRPVTPRAIPIKRVVASDGAERPDMRDVLQRADDQQLQTSPGQRFSLEFEVGRDVRADERTFLLAAQGYYSEWMRGRWLEDDSTKAPFEPWTKPTAPILQRWLMTRESLDQTFFKQRVPIV